MMKNEFDALIDEFLEEAFDRSPVFATSLGADGYDSRLDDLSADAIREGYERSDHWSSVFSRISDDGLAFDQQIDRDLIVATLRGRQIMRGFESYKRDPGTYLSPGLQGVFLLFLNALHPEDELVDFAVSRMRAVPEAIENGKKNLDANLVPKLFAERALGMCRAGTTYFRTLLPAEAQSDSNRQRLAESGEVAAAAFEDFGKLIEKLVSDSAGDWALGEERYSALLREKEVLGYGADEMLERGKAAFEELDIEMSDHTEGWRGTRDWRAVREELREQTYFETPEDLRAEYEKWTNAARAFLVKHDLVTFPEGEKCLVVPSPHFQRPILAVASYSTPPAFKPTRVGHFFVPYPPEGTSEEEVKKRLKAAGALGIASTSVHEAYPGHHWHLVKMKDNPRRIRQALRTSYFVEGWALYAERMMREQGFFEDPAHELGFFAARIFRAARIIVDVSLHTGKMSPDDAVDFLLGNFGGAEPTIRTEVGRYCSWPTQAPSYLTGALEIERMREKYFAQQKGTLKEFHDTLATTGGLPIGLAERALFV